MAEATDKVIRAITTGPKFSHVYIRGDTADNNDIFTVTGADDVDGGVVTFLGETTAADYTISGNVVTIVNGASKKIEGMLCCSANNPIPDLGTL